MKNLTSVNMTNEILPEQRGKSEIKFFQSSQWKKQALSMNWVRIVTLQSYLQTLQDQHIEQELLKLHEEIQIIMVKTEEEIIVLGEEQSTVSHLQMFLSHLMMQFHSLATFALNSTYHEMNSVFSDGPDKNIH